MGKKKYKLVHDLGRTTLGSSYWQLVVVGELSWHIDAPVEVYFATQECAISR